MRRERPSFHLERLVSAFGKREYKIKEETERRTGGKVRRERERGKKKRREQRGPERAGSPRRGGGGAEPRALPLGQVPGRCLEAACDAAAAARGRSALRPRSAHRGASRCRPDPRAAGEIAGGSLASAKTRDEPKGGSGHGRAVLGHLLPERRPGGA